MRTLLGALSIVALFATPSGATPELTIVGIGWGQGDPDACSLRTRDVSNNGIVVGSGSCSQGTLDRRFREGPETGSWVSELSFPDGESLGRITLISPDGTVVVGLNDSDDGSPPIPWQWVYDASGTFLGSGLQDAIGDQAVADRGPVLAPPPELSAAALAGLVAPPTPAFGYQTDFDLGNATVISEDGNVVAGWGTGDSYLDGFGDPRRYTVFWTVSGVPEPNLLLLLVPALAVFGLSIRQTSA